MRLNRVVYLLCLPPSRGLIAAFAVLLFSLSASNGYAYQDHEERSNQDHASSLPLQPKRRIEFTTDEGTWMSLDVSPNGKTITFDLLGDIYTLPLQGGTARLISGGMAFDTQPKFSPDGKLIAFISDRGGSDNLWIMRADGSEPRQLTFESWSDFASPSWSPDGRYVLVSRGGPQCGPCEIWMYGIEGGSGLQVTEAGAPSQGRHLNLGVVASHNGKYLYYAQRNSDASPPFLFGWHIMRLDCKTGEEDVLLQHAGGSFRPVLSPADNILLYITRFEGDDILRLRNLQTGEDRPLSNLVTHDDQESGYFASDLFPGYGFLPDGKSIVLADGGKIYRLNIETEEKVQIPFTALVSQDLGPKLDFPRRVEQGPVKARVIQDPAESPDGRMLAFSALTHLYIMDLPSGKPRRLTVGDAREFQPTWSPDGKWIAFVTWSATTGGQIWKVPSSGGKATQLTHVPAFYRDPAWSPDGRHIVVLRAATYDRNSREYEHKDYIHNNGGDLIWGDVLWLTPDGATAGVIAPIGSTAKPHFTQERDRIYLSTSSGLISMRYDGTDRRTEIQVNASLSSYMDPLLPDDIRISPDGKWVLVHIMNQLYLAAVPPAPHAALTVNITSPAVPVRKLTDIGADYFGWSLGGRVINWTIGSTLFRQSLGAVFIDCEDLENNKDNERDCEKTKEPLAVFREEQKNIQRIAVDVEVPRWTPNGITVLRGARVITMKGDEVLPEADVVVENNRIKSVGSRVTTPSSAKIFDVTGTTIVPGFIDTHAHWDNIRRGILDTQNWNFLADLAYGVTSGLDVSTQTTDAFAYEDLVDAGEMVGLRAFSTGPAVYANNNFQSLDEVKGVLTRYKKYYITPNVKSYVVGNRAQRQFMVLASEELEMMPTTEGAANLKLDLTHVVDGFHGNEHSLPVVPLYRDVIQLFAQSGIAYTPTLADFDTDNYWFENTNIHDDVKLNRFTPREIIYLKANRRGEYRVNSEYLFPRIAAGATQILRAGGLVGVGSHGNLEGLGYHWQMWSLARGGMSPLEVLRCATVNGAKIIGRPQDLGSIEPGKLADLVILKQNPLDDIQNTNTILWVMKNGELFDGDTLNQIWPEAKKMKPLWFQVPNL